MERHIVLFLLLTMGLLALPFAVTAAEKPIAGTDPAMRNITTMELVRDMGLGINLGNTLEACGDWINGDSVSSYETAWGSPIITEKMIAGYAKAGFKSVRIPVAWSNLMAADYVIDPGLLDRVEWVVRNVIKNGMYAIVNIHWDGGWFEGFPSDYDECMRKYRAIWSQVGKRFAPYGDRLVLESLNEEGCFNDVWNRYSGSNKGKDKAYGILNEINQAFVDLVRASGGNNAKRHLLIAGYATDIALTCDPYFKMPKDPENRCAVSVHYYTPPTFAILEKDADWGKARTTWGTAQDVAELKRNMDMMKRTFIDKGVPVILGEYGVSTGNKTKEMVRGFLTAVCEAAYTRGMCPVLWDTTNTFYNRNEARMMDPQLESGLRKIVAKGR